MVLFAEKMLFTSIGQKIIMMGNEKVKHWRCVEVNWNAGESRQAERGDVYKRQD